MSDKGSQQKDLARIAARGTLLGSAGRELKKGLWEDCVYLGQDGHVYHLTGEPRSDGVRVGIAGKRAVGEYLRWVDGLFRPGELPSEANGVHFRAAKKLRELL